MKPTLAVLLLLALAGCGKARASSGATAQLIPSPTSGVSCYAIVNDAGQPVGGSCFKD